MILIGQYDAPFVRRVGIALRLDDLPEVSDTWVARCGAQIRATLARREALPVFHDIQQPFIAPT